MMEEKAKYAFEARDRMRIIAREMMEDEESRIGLYKEHPNKTFEELIEKNMKKKGMTREEALEAIFKSATKTNDKVNKQFGAGGE